MKDKRTGMRQEVEREMHTREIGLRHGACAAGGTWLGCGWRGVGDDAPCDSLLIIGIPIPEQQLRGH